LWPPCRGGSGGPALDIQAQVSETGMPPAPCFSVFFHCRCRNESANILDMQISQHADRSEASTGLRAEDIHHWIDGFFDSDSFNDFQRSGHQPDYNPYNHRKYRHCR
jgi:hypothetical protein